MGSLLAVFGMFFAEQTRLSHRREPVHNITHVLGLARGLASKLPKGKFTIRACRLTPGEVTKAHLPCITFTCCHAWVLFKHYSDGSWEIGEAIGGRRRVPWDEFASHFCGETVLVTPNGSCVAAMLGTSSEIRQREEQTGNLTLAGSDTFLREIDSSGRTMARFGSAPLDKLIAESEGDW